MFWPNTLSFMTSILQFSFLNFLILHHFQLDFEATNLSIYITLHIETQINVQFTIHGLYDTNSSTNFPRTTPRNRGRSLRCARASHVTPQFVFVRSRARDLASDTLSPGQSLASEEDLSIMFTPSSLRIWSYLCYLVITYIYTISITMAQRKRCPF